MFPPLGRFAKRGPTRNDKLLNKKTFIYFLAIGLEMLKGFLAECYSESMVSWLYFRKLLNTLKLSTMLDDEILAQRG
jgi:hypothetical protein